MSAQERLSRLTGFLYGLAIVMFAGTILELIAAKHFQEPMQFVPFVLCVAGVGAVLLAWRRPDRRAIQGLRVLMVVTANPVELRARVFQRPMLRSLRSPGK